MLQNTLLSASVLVFVMTVGVSVFIWRRADKIARLPDIDQRRDSELRELVDVLALYLSDDRHQVPSDLRNNSKSLKNALSIRGRRPSAYSKVSSISQYQLQEHVQQEKSS
jgi:hypothetical protein